MTLNSRTIRVIPKIGKPLHLFPGDLSVNRAMEFSNHHSHLLAGMQHTQLGKYRPFVGEPSSVPVLAFEDDI